MRILALSLAAAAALPLVAAQIAGLAPCGQSCYDGLVAKGASLGCPSGDPACLCTKPDFQNGVEDCANAACTNQGVDPVAQVNLVKEFCAAFQTPAPEATPEPTPSPEVVTPSPEETPSPEPTPPPEPSPPLEPTPSPAPESPAPEQPAPSETAPVSDPAVPAPSPTPEASIPAAETTPAPDSPTTGILDLQTKVGTFRPSSTATTGPDNSDESPDSNPDSQSGLSNGAKIGIAVGAGTAGILLLLALALLLRRSARPHNGPAGRKISEPLPGSGRYPGPDALPRMPAAADFEEKNDSELELTSRRYEDMLPRQMPRQMV